ncbi:MAG: response regulator [Nitrospira sp.]|nr:response regulator [Nitrospira sp.]
MSLILIADDDEQVCGWLRAVLEAEGYRVIEAADGRQALVTIQRESPDLVILDVYLPLRDGLEIILQLHQQQPSVKVFAISGQPVQGYDILRIATIFGAQATLAKPFSIERLLLGVRELVGPAQGLCA